MAAEDQVTQLSNFAMPGLTSVQLSTGTTDQPYLEAATQSYLSGAPLISSSGKLAIALEDVTTAIIVGFASVDASGTTDNPTSVIPALSGLTFEATLEDGTAGDHVLAQADLFAKYGLAKTAAGLWYLDEAETASPAAVVIALIDPIGTVQGRVRARLLNKVCLANT